MYPYKSGASTTTSTSLSTHHSTPTVWAPLYSNHLLHVAFMSPQPHAITQWVMAQAMAGMWDCAWTWPH